jgi:quinoprotein relay system zinc metallohydrolase 2
MFRFILLMLACLSAQATPLTIKEIAPGVYVHHGIHEDMSEGYHGDICNIGFIVGKQSVAVIDTGGSLAIGQQLREAISTVTKLPVSHVINTHIHPDHIFGNAAFKPDNPVFVGHAKLGDAMELRKDTYLRNNAEVLGDAFKGSEIVKPGQTVADNLEIDLGDRILKLQAWPTAHTNTDLTVFDTSTATLWTGDLLFIERTPSMDGDTRNWLKLLPQIKSIPAQRVVPGHGPGTTEWKQAFDRQQQYFEVLLGDIRTAIKNGKSMENTMNHAAASEHDAWVLFQVVNRRNVNLLYPQLEWE